MLYPNSIQKFNSVGERILANKFKDDPQLEKSFVLPSLFCSKHLSRVSGELDFLVLMPNHGIFAIEVKHGGVSRKDGKWLYTNRYKKVIVRNRSPFDQVNKSMQSIKRYVDGKINANPNLSQNLKKIMWGYGVAFTSSVNLDSFEPEAEKWQIFQRANIQKPISEYMENMSNGWHSKYSESSSCGWYSKTFSRPTENDCLLIFRILRGDFDYDYKEINRLRDRKQIIDHYTKEQFDILEQTSYNPRVLIEGAAGTGKTLMAIELVHRKVAEGKNVGLFCFTNSLAEEFKRSFRQVQKDQKNLRYVKTFHSFMYDHIEEDFQISEMSRSERNEFFNEALPLEFIIKASSWTESQKLDFIVIDEAQDLVRPNYLDVIDSVLKGGLAIGHFVLVGDFLRQSLFSDTSEEKLFDLIHQRSQFTMLKLHVNCRNTKEIAEFASRVSNYPFPKLLQNSIRGRKVEVRYPIKSKILGQVIEVLKEIEKNKIPFNNVTILTHKTFNKTILKSSPQILEYIECRGLTHSTIMSFKGLENDVIVLVSDYGESNFEKYRGAIYVACTRANQLLYTVFTNKAKTFITDQLENNNSD